MSLRETTFPAACTPLSVRAQRTKDDFLGSTALALEMALAATKAANKSPSIVFSVGHLRYLLERGFSWPLMRFGTYNCIPWYPVPE